MFMKHYKKIYGQYSDAVWIGKRGKVTINKDSLVKSANITRYEPGNYRHRTEQKIYKYSGTNEVNGVNCT